ncbi:phospholipase A2 inhibitor and Ly6/PLAUR domain-containing protein-like [Leptodactylus fuscus]|uniref:phospholipase A2 inhibitor and Ly6/PLAUR domain-containing protein-like n=1 Tax=Leptodactylus fuscus TaxID=238119 RepID=UPI003F4F1F56
MKTVLSTCLIFSITIATGTCLLCESCRNFTGDVCTKPSNETCDPSVENCISVWTFVKNGETYSPQIIKSCATHPIRCHFTYNMSGGQELYNVAKCCRGDMCNQGAMQMPPIDRTENGVQCPACFKEGKSCIPKENMKCQGPQKKCFSFSGEIYNGSHFVNWAFQGCATGNVCQYRSPYYPETSIKEGYTMQCSDSAHNLHVAGGLHIN